jgi:hypothetical protein
MLVYNAKSGILDFRQFGPDAIGGGSNLCREADPWKSISAVQGRL